MEDAGLFGHIHSLQKKQVKRERQSMRYVMSARVKQSLRSEKKAGWERQIGEDGEIGCGREREGGRGAEGTPAGARIVEHEARKFVWSVTSPVYEPQDGTA